MMTYLVMLVLLTVAAVLQLHLPAPALLGYAKPPLVLAVVLYYALNRDARHLWVAALLGGVLLDALSPGPLGLSVAGLAILGRIALHFRVWVLTDSMVTAAFFGAVGGAMLTVAMYAVLAAHGQAAWPAGRLAVKTLAVALAGAVCVPAVFALASRLDQWVGNVVVREVIDGIEQPLGH